MKQLIKNIWSMICALREAGYAANLARNGKIKQAQAVYRD